MFRIKNNNKKDMAKKKIVLEEPVEETKQDLGIGGLGDLIAKVTDSLGIEKCEGCEKRQDKLNHLMPWLKVSRELTEDEKEFIRFIQQKQIIQSNDVNRLFVLYNEIYYAKNKRCNCPELIGKMIQRLNDIL